LPKRCTEQLEVVNASLVTATGERSKFLGKCKVPLEMDGVIVHHEVCVADIQNEGILGFDFMSKHKCNICMKDLSLTVLDKGTISLHLSPVGTSCCRVMIAENTTIPANSETIVSGLPSKQLKTNESSIIAPVAKFVDENSLLMAKSINDGKLNTIPLRIMNPTNQTLTVEKGYIAATCEVIEIVENKQTASICSVTTSFRPI